MKKIKALFLDRDGVINIDFGYVSNKENFKFCDGIFEGIRGFMKLGYTIFVVTNQSGIARGYYSLDDFLNVNKFMLEILTNNKIDIKKVYFCPHGKDEDCICRKPAPGMILEASREFNIDLKKSIMIGDKNTDMMASNAAGVGKFYKIGDEFKTLFDIYKKVQSMEK